MNKYERKPEFIVDLHGHSRQESKKILDGLIADGKYKHVRVITGKAAFRESGPVLRNYVQRYLDERGIRFETAKLYNGGEGALEVYFK